MLNIIQRKNRFSMRYLLPVLILLFLISCGSTDSRPDKSKLPSDSLITKAKMILMLADMHTVEAILMIKRNKGEDPQKYARIYFDKVFEKYGVSRERFNMNMDYYKEDPEQFYKMYESVVQVLVNRQKFYSPRE